MRKDNFYTLIIIVLLLVNIGTLGYLWVSKKEIPSFAMPPRPESPRDIMIKELQLDKEQERKLYSLSRQHRKSMDSVQRQIRNAQKALFALVKTDDLDTAKKDSVLAIIEAGESQKHLITIEHFHDIRAMLDEEQKVYFNEMMEDIGNRITNPGPPPHHRPMH